MGKTTLYHPVPMSVIRGAAEYRGWKFSTIKQFDSQKSHKYARYTARIETMPKRVWAKPLHAMQEDLQECFLDDIRCFFLRKTKRGVYYVDLQVGVGTVAEK